MSYKISALLAREVLDSRGNPTVEVEMSLADGSWGRAIVPSGASKGQHEALELRDEDPKRYLGKGTKKAVEQVQTTLTKLLVGRDIGSIKVLDQLMLEADGTEQKSKLGGNTLLGVSLAFLHAVSQSKKKPMFLVVNDWMGLSPHDLKLPVPLMNIINGGVHANNGLEIQEFMIVPHGFSTFSESLRAGVEVFHHLKSGLKKRGLSVAVGDEGGFAPDLKSNEEALDCVAEAITKAGYQIGKQISLALDVAASSFYNQETGAYDFRYAGQTSSDRANLVNFYTAMLEKYPIVSIEDALDENDWKGWGEVTSALGQKTQLVGDDLFVTQASRVKRGITEKVANSVLIKVNQVGTLTETFETMLLCRSSGYSAITSHRSGETEDVTIAHIAVGSGCGQIKTGSLSRSERTAKYNELLRIEEWGKRHGVNIPFAQNFKR